jgi:polyhydroxyalkanoate synthesis regulator phasin
MPFELMKKIMLTFIGLALKTPQEIESMAKEMIKKSKMGEKEGKKFLDEVMKKYEQAKKDMEKKIRKGISEYMGDANIASKKEVNTLKKEINNLKKKKARKK